MYLVLIVISFIYLFMVNWRIATPLLIIVFCLDRIMDKYRQELERKTQELSEEISRTKTRL